MNNQICECIPGNERTFVCDECCKQPNQSDKEREKMNQQTKNCTCDKIDKTEFLCEFCYEMILNPIRFGRNKEIKTTNENVQVIQCEMCEKYVKTEFQGHDYPFVDRGSEITIHGGYGQFYDPTREDEVISVTVCHDCTLMLFRMIPKLKKMHGMHSVSYKDKSYPLCCEYSWFTNPGSQNVVYGTKENFLPQETFEV